MNHIMKLLAPAESRPDPWWTDPAEEKLRMARVEALVAARLTPQQLAKVFFKIFNSSNDNTVLYFGEPAPGGGLEIVPMWFRAHPPDMKEEDDKGNRSLLAPLEGIHSKIYGFVVDDSMRIKMKMDLVADKELQLFMSPCRTKAGVFTSMGTNKPRVKLSCGYAQMRRGSTPSPQYMTLYGTCVTTRESVSEVITLPELSMSELIGLVS